MALWPRDHRIDALAPNNEAQGKSRNFPNLEQGLVGAITLSEDANKRLSWISASKTSNDAHETFQKRLNFGKQVQICSPTHSLVSDPPRISVRRRAEQGANFLRTYLPDVEIPEELIRHQLIEDTTRSRELQKFNPYAGNLLDVLERQHTDDAVLATFAAGETNQVLKFTSVHADDCTQSLEETDNVLCTFPTPIEQIVSSKQSNVSIAVRTYGSTKVLKTDWSNNPTRPVAEEGVSFTRKSLNNETIVDMQYSADGSELMLVGDTGSIFGYHLLSGKQYSASSSSTLGDDHFWRLSLGTTAFDHFVMSAQNLFHLDKRTDSCDKLFSLPTRKHVFTSIENCRTDNLLSLCSTKQVLWMDIRFPRTPLLAFTHERENDRYLSAHTFHCSSTTPLTILTSRNNSLVTVYDVSKSLIGLRLNAVPYCLSSNRGMYQPHVGQQIIERRDSTALLWLSPDAGLTCNELILSEFEAEDKYVSQKLVIKYKNPGKNADIRSDTSPLGLQECKQVDFQAAYEEMFCKHFEANREAEAKLGESMDQIVDHFPSYLLNKEDLPGYLLTTHDIARRAGDNTSNLVGNNFLGDSLVTSKPGYLALKHGKLSPQLVHAPWHMSLLPILQKFDEHLFENTPQMWDYLQNFNLLYDEAPPNRVLEYEEDACQQLIVDLTLSSDIFAPTLPSQPGQLDQTLEVMTEALTLGDEPPPVEFGFLRPQKKHTPDDEEDEDSSQGLDMPLGVRLLLQGWDTSDPETFEYQDPYNAAGEVMPIKFKKSPSQSQPSVSTLNSQRPPTVLTSNVTGLSQPDPIRRTVPKVQSQTQTQLPPLYEFPGSSVAKAQVNSSQEPMASTQVLPGPYGARLNVKKKPAKKRLGGF